MIHTSALTFNKSIIVKNEEKFKYHNYLISKRSKVKKGKCKYKTTNLSSRAFFILTEEAAKRGFTENEGCKSDVSGAGNIKSFLARSSNFQKSEKKLALRLRL